MRTKEEIKNEIDGLYEAIRKLNEMPIITNDAQLRIIERIQELFKELENC